MNRLHILWVACICGVAACAESHRTMQDELADATARDDPELSDALDREGVGRERTRADLLFRALCAKYASCQDIDARDCFQEHSLKWDTTLASGYDSVCLDMQLDLFSCLAQVECTDETSCDSLAGALVARCADTVAPGDR